MHFDRKNLLLFLASLSVSLVLAVVGYEALREYQYAQWLKQYSGDKERWYGGVIVPSDNKKLMWEYRAGGETIDEIGASIKINRDGFRGRDFPNGDEATGEKVVAFVGDSVTFGLGVEEPETFVHLAEDRLNRANPAVPYRALNFGVVGYDTLQIAELVESRIFYYSPDLVVYVMCLNDFDLRDASAGLKRYFVRPKYFFVQDFMRAYRYFMERDYYRRNFNFGKDTVFSSLKSLKELLDERGVEFMLVIVPVLEMGGTAEEAYSLSHIHAEIKRRSEGIGITTIDLLDSLVRQLRPLADFGLDPLHLNKTGHELVAQRLAEVVGK